MVASTETRLCEQCVTERPLGDFRRRSRNGSARMRQCRGCHNEDERRRRANRQARAKNGRMTKSLTKLSEERNNKRLEKLARAVFDEFGGLAGFVAAFAAYRAKAMKRGGLAALRSFEFVLRMQQYLAERQSEPDDLTEEEIVESTTDALVRLVRSHPELAVAAAMKLGWVVEPSRGQF